MFVTQQETTHKDEAPLPATDTNLCLTVMPPQASVSYDQHQEMSSNIVCGEHMNRWPAKNTSLWWFFGAFNGPKKGHLITCPCTLPLVAWARQWPLTFPYRPAGPRPIYIYKTLTHPTHFHPEDERQHVPPKHWQHCPHKNSAKALQQNQHQQCNWF
jgi:hypothetical protein